MDPGVVTNRFTKHYLLWLIITGVCFGFGFIPLMLHAESGSELALWISIFTTLVLITTGAAGGLDHLFDKVIRPAARKRMLRGRTFTGLEDLGLKINHDTFCYYGVYKGYYLTITAECDWGGPRIVINALVIYEESRSKAFTKLSWWKLRFREFGGFTFFMLNLTYLQMKTRIVKERLDWLTETLASNGIASLEFDDEASQLPRPVYANAFSKPFILPMSRLRRI